MQFYIGLVVLVVVVVVECVKINEIQVKGTHNSYHLRNPDCDINDKPCVPNWDYYHSALKVQLEDEDVRQFEFDFKYDQFATALEDKFPVVHVPTFDAFSLCSTLSVCLTQLRQWSDDNGATQPLIFIHLELKQAEDLDASKWKSFDEVLRSAYPDYRILQPDTIRQTGKTLRETVTNGGWIGVENTGGMVMFTLDLPYSTYVTNDLKGRAAFPAFSYSNRMNDNAAVLLINDPQTNYAQIQDAVNSGYLVRTRADSDFPYSGPYTQQVINQAVFYVIDHYSDTVTELTAEEVHSFVVALATAANYEIPFTADAMAFQINAAGCGMSPYNLTTWSCVMDFAQNNLDAYNILQAATLPNLSQRLTRRQNAIASGAQLVSTDFPVSRNDATGDAVNYAVTLGHPYTCNPLLNNPSCDVGTLQSATMPDPNEPDDDQPPPNKKKSKFKLGVVIVGIVVVVLAIVSLLAFCCYRFSKRKYEFSRHAEVEMEDGMVAAQVSR